jgi:hypothetical protein
MAKLAAAEAEVVLEAALLLWEEVMLPLLGICGTHTPYTEQSRNHRNK